MEKRSGKAFKVMQQLTKASRNSVMRYPSRQDKFTSCAFLGLLGDGQTRREIGEGDIMELG